MNLIFVIPALNERPNIDTLGRRLNAAVSRCATPARVVMVDDGSTDGTRDAAASTASGRCVA